MGEDMEQADFWTAFNEWNFIILKQNCSLIFVSTNSPGTPLSSLLDSLPIKDLHRGAQKGPFLSHSGKNELRLKM